MTRHAFVDTSVLVRFLVQDIPDQAPRAVRLFADVASHDVRVSMSETVVLEAVYVLSTLYDVPRATICSLLTEILQLEGINLHNKPTILESLRFWESQGPLSFADCYHLALTAALGLGEIYSFDKKMGRYPGVRRIEP